MTFGLRAKWEGSCYVEKRVGSSRQREQQVQRSWDHQDLPCMIWIQGMGPGSGPSATGMVERDEVEELAFWVVSWERFTSSPNIASQSPTASYKWVGYHQSSIPQQKFKHILKEYSSYFSEEIEVLQTYSSVPHFSEGGSEVGIGHRESPQVHSPLVAGIGQVPEVHSWWSHILPTRQSHRRKAAVWYPFDPTSLYCFSL